MSGAERIAILGSTLTSLALIRAARGLKLPTALIDTTRGIAWSSHLPHKYLVPNDDRSILRGLIELAAKTPTALIADSDHWLRFIARNREVLAQHFVDILHPSNECFEICLNKTNFLTWCARHGLAAPRLYQPDAAPASAANFPLMIRPSETRHNIADDIPKAVVVNTVGELEHWLERYRSNGAQPDICESLLSPTVRAYSVGAARNRAGELLTMVAQKIRTPPSSCSGGTYVELSPQPAVEALARSALQQLDYYGIAEVEIMFEPRTGQASLIEVNARPWVQYGLAERVGFRLLSFIVEGKSTSECAPALANRVTGAWLNFSDDLLVCFSKHKGLLREGQLSLGEYLRTAWKANAYAMWDARDPVPFLKSTARFLSRTLGLDGRSPP